MKTSGFGLFTRIINRITNKRPYPTKVSEFFRLINNTEASFHSLRKSRDQKALPHLLKQLEQINEQTIKDYQLFISTRKEPIEEDKVLFKHLKKAKELAISESEFEQKSQETIALLQASTNKTDAKNQFAVLNALWKKQQEHLTTYLTELNRLGGYNYYHESPEIVSKKDVTRVEKIIHNALNNGQRTEVKKQMERIIQEVLDVENAIKQGKENALNLKPIKGKNKYFDGRTYEADAKTLNRQLNQTGRGDWRYYFTENGTFVNASIHDRT